MLILKQQFAHPTQVGQVTLSVFEQQVPADSPAAESAILGQTGFLLTEERSGSRRVYSTLGFYARREEAEGRLRERADQLTAQRWSAA